MGNIVLGVESLSMHTAEGEQRRGWLGALHVMKNMRLRKL